MSHTPGPWKAITGKSNYPFDVEDDEGFIICRVVDGPMDSGQHNAKLLAAAPELAFQLTTLLAFIEGMREGGTPVIPEIDDPAKATLRAAGLITVDAPKAPLKS